MDPQLLVQLKSWNPWWQLGLKGTERYKDPLYKREIFNDIWRQFKSNNLIISIVGMRQVGKSTIMRQMIRDLLENNTDAKQILYVSFDDPYLRANYDQKKIFEDVVHAYTEHILSEDISTTTKELYFFFDEIHQLPQWEKILKTYFDRSFPIRYTVSGSSSIRLQHKNRESLLGRISEHILWPFSFREYIEQHAFNANNLKKLSVISELRDASIAFMKNRSIDGVIPILQKIFIKTVADHKIDIVNNLKKFILEGGFPRVWQQSDLASKQRTLWEHHVAKVIFEDLPQVAKIRKVRDLEFLYVRVVDFNGKEAVLSELQKDLKVHWETLDRYLNYLNKTFLLFRVDRTKSKRSDRKRRAGNVKFYVTDIALRNALRRRTEEVYDDPEEMGYIAETLVCTAIQRWGDGLRHDDSVTFFRDKTGEVDFIVKDPNAITPIEVKWRGDIPALKTMDRLCDKWEIKESILVTKDYELTYKNGRLSIPLWFFLLVF